MDDAYGRCAYEAYSVSAGGKSLVTGDPLPAWDELPAPVRAAWIAAALAVASVVSDTGEA